MRKRPHRLDDHSRFTSVIGLGFGDCGKGLFTDFLCRRYNAHTVVRFNGGAQAGHNVVLPDGTHHTFSQFGSGTFIAGVHTVLAHPVIMHPTALLIENEVLRAKGVTDALPRLLIDGRCRVVTPFHQAAGRVREHLRGAGAHGSCGAGIGETAKYSIEFPDQTLRFSELAHTDIVREKCETLRRRLLNELSEAAASRDEVIRTEYALLEDEGLTGKWIAAIAPLVRHLAPCTGDQIAERLHQPGSVIFEGAQGVLLDEWRGFHPHTTWSQTTAHAAEAVADEYSPGAEVRHLGVLRTYMSRHGAGPFPTADPALDYIGEAHNTGDGWQGLFRRGHPDELLLRYSLDCAGNLAGLLLSHLDAFDRGHIFKRCTAYETGDGIIRKISPCAGTSLDYQHQLTQLLRHAKPLYDERQITSARESIGHFSNLSALPVIFGSYGPSHREVEAFDK